MQLLPSWPAPVQSVLIYLQPSPVQLNTRTSATEEIKDTLRLQFLAYAGQWREAIMQAGFLAEPFDPKYGTPIYAPPGEWPLDDVAVAHALLKYPMTFEGGCKILHHPEWESGTFPSTLLSSAPPALLQELTVAMI